MNAGTPEGGIVGRGGKTKFDGESNPAKEFGLDGPNQSEEWALPANIFNLWALTNDQ